MTRDATFTVRPFHETDEAAVVALWHIVFADDPPRNNPRRVIQRKLGVQRELFLVGEHDGTVVATVLAGYDGYRGWVYHLAVSPAQRGLGFGRIMMAEVEQRLRALGCVKLNLQVRRPNANVVGFYERLGYVIDDHVSMGKSLPEVPAR